MGATVGLPIATLADFDLWMFNDASATICHNAHCAMRLIDQLPERGFSVSLKAEDSFHTAAAITVIWTQDTAWVAGEFTGPDELWEDGDRFDATVVNAQGETIVARSWQASFGTVEDQCGTHCLQSELMER